jgi:hypothetical protein
MDEYDHSTNFDSYEMVKHDKEWNEFLQRSCEDLWVKITRLADEQVVQRVCLIEALSELLRCPAKPSSLHPQQLEFTISFPDLRHQFSGSNPRSRL